MYPETVSQDDILSWGDFMMIRLFPDHLLYPKNGSCGLKVASGGALGLSKPHSWGIWHAVWAGVFFFAWLAWFFVSLGNKGFFSPFPGLGEGAAAIFGGFSKWAGQLGFGPRSETSGKGKRPKFLQQISTSFHTLLVHFGPRYQEKLSQWEKSTPNPPASSAVKRGPTPEIHQVPICLPKLLHKPFLFCFWFWGFFLVFFPPWDRSLHHISTHHVVGPCALFFFPWLLIFCSGLCADVGRYGLTVQYLAFIYLFISCCVGILSINEFFSLSCTSIHFLLVERDCWNPSFFRGNTLEWMLFSWTCLQTCLWAVNSKTAQTNRWKHSAVELLQWC